MQVTPRIVTLVAINILLMIGLTLSSASLLTSPTSSPGGMNGYAAYIKEQYNTTQTFNISASDYSPTIGAIVPSNEQAINNQLNSSQQTVTLQKAGYEYTGAYSTIGVNHEEFSVHVATYPLSTCYVYVDGALTDTVQGQDTFTVNRDISTMQLGNPSNQTVEVTITIEGYCDKQITPLYETP